MRLREAQSGPKCLVSGARRQNKALDEVSTAILGGVAAENQLLNNFLYNYFINCVMTKKLMEFAKKFKKSFSKLYNTKKSYDMQLLDNNEKETFMGSFPQVDSRYGKILALRQVPREEWNEHQKWVTYLHFCNKYRHAPDDPVSIPLFIGKPTLKNQTSAQQDQARHAIEFCSVIAGAAMPAKTRI